MTEKSKNRKLLAEVVCGTPPGPMNLQEFEAWRAADIERMAREAADQVIAMLELQGGAIRH